MLNLKKTTSQRIGWETHLKPFLYKKLPSNLGWSATLGSLCAILFAVMAGTGMVLAMYYSPSPDKAYQSIAYIMNDLPMGSILRGLHHWGAGAMVLAVFIHLASVYFSGSFKKPRELTWILGVCLFLVTLGLGFTGYLLPWDQKAFWATVVSSNIPRDIPVMGQLLANLLLSGDNVSGLTITRFYAIHMLVLPTLMMGLMVGHIYLIRLHGVCEHESSPKPDKDDAASRIKENTLYRFFPEHCSRSSLVFLGVLAILLLLSVFGQIPGDKIAGTIDESYLPRPEWYYMWLFQMLTYFSGSTEAFGSLVIPTAGILILFGIPFIEKTNFLKAAKRPLSSAVGVTCIVCIVYLTLTGFSGARPYGEIIPVPDRQLTQSEELGLGIYVDQNCAYCHNIDGQGGHRVGPDMVNMIDKDKTREYLAAFIKDPQSQSAWSIMPKYELKPEELNGTADFILSLDFDKNGKKILKKEEVSGKIVASNKP